MHPLTKAFWKIRNGLEATMGRISGNTGILSHRQDDRDHISNFGVMPYTPSSEKLSHFKYQFRQRDNICTAASTIMAISEQTGVRWSVKALMRMMVKLGMVHGNGFSYQRAPLEVIIKYGLIPYYLMPDENNSGWAEYSRWDSEMDRLYRDVAPKFKFASYKKLVNDVAVFQALDNGYVPITASGWYTGMNRPQAPNFLLRAIGGYIGDHQYRVTGYRESGANIETPQTFGPGYGDNGKAWSEKIFGKGYFDKYILDNNDSPLLPAESILPIFLKENDGMLVRSKEDQACYMIENGVKRWVSGEDNMATFNSLFDKFGLTYVKKELLAAVPQGDVYPFIS